MKIRILKVSEIEGNKVYLRRIGNRFEYLLIFNSELYSANVIVNRKFWQPFLFETEIKATCKILLQMAESTVTALKEKIKNNETAQQ